MDKASRLEKILPNGKGLWIPIDHGLSDYPNPGLEDTEALIRELVEAKVDVIVAQKGLVDYYSHLCQGTKTSMVIHLSASTRHGGDDASRKVLVGNPSEILTRGGIGASAQVNMGTTGEAEMLEALGKVTTDSHHIGLPVLGMVYARGANLNPVSGDKTQGVSQAARVAFEMGCDVAKTTWTGDSESFKHVISAAPIPMLVAGGANTGDTRSVLLMVENAMKAGAAGVCMGRQVFAHKNPGKVAMALRRIIHEGVSSTVAADEFNL
jgi:DhnA family fructose-bisphosphate aldolase class Ia